MRYLSFAAIILVLFCLAGCGGGGGSVPSPYAGSWSGLMGVASGGGSGTGGSPSQASLTVDSKGRINGTWADSVGSGALTGRVNNDGAASMIVSMGAETATGQGVTTIAQDGHWAGNLVVSDPAGASITFDLSRQ